MLLCGYPKLYLRNAALSSVKPYNSEFERIFAMIITMMLPVIKERQG